MTALEENEILHIINNALLVEGRRKGDTEVLRAALQEIANLILLGK